MKIKLSRLIKISSIIEKYKKLKIKICIKVSYISLLKYLVLYCVIPARPKKCCGKNVKLQKL